MRPTFVLPLACPLIGNIAPIQPRQRSHTILSHTNRALAHSHGRPRDFANKAARHFATESDGKIRFHQIQSTFCEFLKFYLIPYQFTNRSVLRKCVCDFLKAVKKNNTHQSCVHNLSPFGGILILKHIYS